MTQTVLILGGSGRFGRNATRSFEHAGWQVRQFNRKRDRLKDALQGVDVVVNAWNPVNYAKWAKELRPLHARVIDALRGSGVTVIVPGNVYVYGTQTGPWSAQTPHFAANALCQMRCEMEAAYRASGLQVILLRAGDFLDTTPSDSWFDRVMVAKLNKGIFTYPGRADAAHAWAFLPDLTRAAVALADMRDSLPQYNDIPFPGYTMTGAQMAEALGRITGRDITLKHMPWWPVRLMAPVVPMLRGLNQMRYLWDMPHELDGTALHALLPDFKTTRLDHALAHAVGDADVADIGLQARVA